MTAALIRYPRPVRSSIVNNLGAPALGAGPNILTVPGIDPTGKTSNDAAIALALSSWKEVYFPPGVYGIGANVNVTSDRVRLEFAGGAKLLALSAGINGIVLAGNYADVVNAEVDGNSLMTGSCVLIHGSYNRVEGGYLHGTSGTAGHGVDIDGTSTTGQYNEVTGVRISNVAGIGISQSKAADSRLVSNTILTTGLESITVDNQSYRCVIHANNLTGACQTGGAAAISLDEGDLATIIGNIIEASKQDGIKSNNNLGATNFVVVNGNVILDSGGYGINLFKGLLGSASNWTLTGNIVRGSTTGSMHFDVGSNSNIAVGNSMNGVAPVNSGASNVLANNN